MQNSKSWNLLRLTILLPGVFYFLSCGEGDSSTKGDWKVKVLSVKSPGNTVNGAKQRSLEQLDVEIEITYSGSDSSIVEPSDFAVVDAEGKKYSDPTIALPSQHMFSSGSSSFFALTARATEFAIGPREKIEKTYRFSVSNNLRNFKFRFKDLPPIEIGPDATLLLMASEVGNTEVVKQLLEANADVNVSDNYGWTPLFLASRDGHIEIVKMLLEEKADVNASSESGKTPLYLASYNGQTEIVELLLKEGAEVNAALQDGVTPLSIAKKKGHIKVIELLETYGGRE